MSLGIVAPKDPTKKGKGYLLYKDLKIQPVLRNSGRRTMEIYLNDGRIISATQITGGVKDERILKNLETAKGIEDMVTALGISITAADTSAKFQFGLIMYGHQDVYNSGSHVYCDVTANGVEVMIPFDEVKWSEDDNIIGQFEIEFPDGLELADVTVTVYVKDEYDVPELEEDEQVDVTSAAYSALLDQSIVSMGNNERILKAINKAKNGEDVTVAFIGGSIRQGAGAVPIAHNCYARLGYEAFADLFGGENMDHIHFIKAGIGGTPSELGVVRYEKDVLQFGKRTPDIVIIEFAVNDEGDETKGECYEGLMRKIWNSENQPAVILLFSVFAFDWNLQDRLIPIGEKYQVPMISIMDAVTGQFALEKEKGRVVTKRQFFYDMYHPSNIGHTLMADCLKRYFEKAADMAEKKDLVNPPIAMSGDFEKVKYFDRKYTNPDIRVEEGSFTDTDTELQNVELDKDALATPTFPDNWMHIGASNEPLRFEIDCRILMLVAKDSADNAVGSAVVKVDGKEMLCYNPHDIGWTHPNAVIVLREQEVKKHTVEIAMKAGDEQKQFSILGFGYVNE